MFIYLSILIVACGVRLNLATICQQESSVSAPLPCFDVRSFPYSHDRKSPLGSELVLECYVAHKSNYTVVWSHDKQFISMNDRIISPDPNIRVDSDGERRFNLVLSNLDTEKNGAYECSIVAKPYQTLEYTVDVLVPPQITREPTLDEIVLNEGDNLVVQCLTSGNPKPELTYSKHNGEKGKHTAIDVTNSTMELTSVDESYAGLYSCTATNGVGIPATSEFQIFVRFKPRVKFHQEANMHQNVMFTSQGKLDQIRCLVDGYPRPVVSLLRNGSPISEQSYTYEKTAETKDQVRWLGVLTLKNLELNLAREKYVLTYNLVGSPETFGIYECIAKNDLGTSVAELKVTPHVSAIKLSPADKHLIYSDAIVFEWSLYSGSPINELNVEVFTENGTNFTSEIKRAKAFLSVDNFDDTSIAAPATYHHENHIVYKGYLDVTKLATNTSYTIRMRAKNEFNEWSEWSQNLTAHTGAEDAEKITGTKHRSLQHHLRMLHHDKKHKHYQLSGSRDLNGGKRDKYNADMFENAADKTLVCSLFSLLLASSFAAVIALN